ncbi:hypothetical protein AMK59_3142 [Oryctes borbonicus]|uniref:YLP motif-containing protein 1 n=1 Tax=Oryctes borbonicus TaxID=1629725 RepID=A0A0T6B850_9SCAR|nr:hypothetical protein AMK59_3142 [Oryctes borbonicus]
MAWQPWSAGTPAVVPGLAGLGSVVNPAPAVLPAGSQYTPEQWTQMQQQNWQQWAQWQQQYQQWHQQYGAEYQKSMTALSQVPQGTSTFQPPVPNTSVPPPLPKESKPPLPPEEPPKENLGNVQNKNFNPQPNFMSAPPPNFNPGTPQSRNQPPPNARSSGGNFNKNKNYNNRSMNQNVFNDSPRNAPPRQDHSGEKRPVSQPSFKESKKTKLDDSASQRSSPTNPNDDMSETEKRFVKQFTEWEAQFNKWKEQNMNHPDKEQYREYEKKWETWRTQLLERREQMRRRRLGLSDSKSGQKPLQVPQVPLNVSFPPPLLNKDLDTTKPPPLMSQDVSAITKECEPIKDPFPDQTTSLLKDIMDDGSPVERPEEGESDDFLKMSKNNDGIPGLDLVKEGGGDDDERGEDVIDLDRDENKKLKDFQKGIDAFKGPDFEAISKGINNILGDQKLLNMLSMVSQNQNQTFSASIDTTSRIPTNPDFQNNFRKSNENSGQGGDRWSNPADQQDYFNRGNDNVSNYDDQSRSSFGGRAGEFDWRDRQRVGNSGDFNSGIDDFDKNYDNDNFEGQGDYNRQEAFREGDNFRDSSNFRGSDHFRGGPDNYRGESDNFRGRSENYRGGPVTFRGGPDNFRGGPDYRGGSDNFRGGSDNFRGVPDNFRGGPDNYRGGPDNFRKGVDVRGGPDNFRERPDVRGGPDNFRERPAVRSGPDNFRERDDVRGGPDNFRERPDVRGGPDNFREESDGRGGPDAFRQRSDARGGPDNFREESDVRSGPDNFRQRPDIRGGPDNFRERPDNRGGPANLREGPSVRGGFDNFRERPDFGADPDNFRDGPNNFKGGVGIFRGGPENFRDGPNNLRDGPLNFRGDTDFRGRIDGFRGDQAPDNKQASDNIKGPSNYRGANDSHQSTFEPPLNDNFRGRFELPNRNQQNFNRDDEFNRFDDDHRRVGDFGRRQDREFGSATRNLVDFRPNDDIRRNYPDQDNVRPNERRDFPSGDVDNFKPAPNQQGPNSYRGGADYQSPPPNFARGPNDFNRGPGFPADRGNFGPNMEEPNDYRIPPENMGDWPTPRRNDFDRNQNFSPEDIPSRQRYDNFGSLEPLQNTEQIARDLAPIPEPSNDSIAEEKEEKLWQPINIIEYEHKSLRTDDLEVSFEPLRSFDYRHKPINRIPFPHRPPWLATMLKKYPDFDFALPRNYDQPYTRYPQRFDRYPETSRYENRWSNPPGTNRRPSDESNRHSAKRYDDYTPNISRRHEGPSNYPIKKDHDRSIEDIEMRDVSRESKYDNSYKNKLQPRTDLSPIEIEEPLFAQSECEKFVPIQSKPLTSSNITLIQDILNPPGRYNRPARIVIILRGPPGSGKTFLAKLIKDKEVENGGSAPRILSLDDYFMVEQEKEVEVDGKKTQVKEMVYEYEECMENTYRVSLFKAFKKTITDGYFPFIIVDNVNDKVKYFGEMWSFAKQNGFQVYICQLEFDLATCTKRNIHNRSEGEIQKLITGWEPTPSHHPTLDATSLIQAGSIPEVEMEEINSPASDEFDDQTVEERASRSKWDNFDCSIDNLAKLDGTNKPLRTSKTMEDYLQCDDDWVSRESKPGQKRVRWADLEERKTQEKMRAIGFVVGQTNWDRMMDPTMGSSALTQTKYIERSSNSRFYKM